MSAIKSPRSIPKRSEDLQVSLPCHFINEFPLKYLGAEHRSAENFLLKIIAHAQAMGIKHALASTLSSYAQTELEKSKIKRPPNSFFCFKSALGHAKKMTSSSANPSSCRQRERNKEAAEIWAGLSNDQKLPFENLGRQLAREHKKRFPKYVFCPKPKSTGKPNGKRTRGKVIKSPAPINSSDQSTTPSELASIDDIYYASRSETLHHGKAFGRVPEITYPADLPLDYFSDCKDEVSIVYPLITHMFNASILLEYEAYQSCTH